jgi:hypothetical protein
MNAAVERELRFGRVDRSPMQIIRDFHAGASSVAEMAPHWQAILPRQASIDAAARTLTGLQRLLNELTNASTRESPFVTTPLMKKQIEAEPLQEADDAA